MPCQPFARAAIRSTPPASAVSPSASSSGDKQATPLGGHPRSVGRRRNRSDSPSRFRIRAGHPQASDSRNRANQASRSLGKCGLRCLGLLVALLAGEQAEVRWRRQCGRRNLILRHVGCCIRPVVAREWTDPRGAGSRDIDSHHELGLSILREPATALVHGLLKTDRRAPGQERRFDWDELVRLNRLAGNPSGSESKSLLWIQTPTHAWSWANRTEG